MRLPSMSLTHCGFSLATIAAVLVSGSWGWLVEMAVVGVTLGVMVWPIVVMLILQAIRISV